jgi:hypothetical protein
MYEVKAAELYIKVCCKEQAMKKKAGSQRAICRDCRGQESASAVREQSTIRSLGMKRNAYSATGVGFVATQSILAHTFSRVLRIAELDIVKSAGGVNIPTAKNTLFQIAAYDRDGVPDIVGIHALAHYFKHASE